MLFKRSFLASRMYYIWIRLDCLTKMEKSYPPRIIIRCHFIRSNTNLYFKIALEYHNIFNRPMHENFIKHKWIIHWFVISLALTMQLSCCWGLIFIWFLSMLLQNFDQFESFRFWNLQNLLGSLKRFKKQGCSHAFDMGEAKLPKSF